jgi:hypothetical protein
LHILSKKHKEVSSRQPWDFESVSVQRRRVGASPTTTVLWESRDSSHPESKVSLPEEVGVTKGVTWDTWRSSELTCTWEDPSHTTITSPNTALPFTEEEVDMDTLSRLILVGEVLTPMGNSMVVDTMEDGVGTPLS